jgi:pimeloyl-ACP methyl ester carboxylesterase
MKHLGKHRGLPYSSLKGIPNTGHLSHEEQPKASTEEVTSF